MGLLRRKVAVFTGSGRGVGEAIAILFAKEGASVVRCGHYRKLADKLEGSGLNAIACPGDVTDKDFPEELMGAAFHEFGRVNIFINNAGYTWDISNSGGRRSLHERHGQKGNC